MSSIPKEYFDKACDCAIHSEYVGKIVMDIFSVFNTLITLRMLLMVIFSVFNPQGVLWEGLRW